MASMEGGRDMGGYLEDGLERGVARDDAADFSHSHFCSSRLFKFK